MSIKQAMVLCQTAKAIKWGIIIRILFFLLLNFFSTDTNGNSPSHWQRRRRNDTWDNSDERHRFWHVSIFDLDLIELGDMTRFVGSNYTTVSDAEGRVETLLELQIQFRLIDQTLIPWTDLRDMRICIRIIRLTTNSTRKNFLMIWTMN